MAQTFWPRDGGTRGAARCRVAAAPDLVVEIAGDGFCGAVTASSRVMSSWRTAAVAVDCSPSAAAS
jgi:hypothetical protein